VLSSIIGGGGKLHCLASIIDYISSLHLSAKTDSSTLSETNNYAACTVQA